MKPVRFTIEDAQKASDEWQFNCGPGALCAILGLTPDELRPNLGEFEAKGYTNPTLMKETLGRCGAKWHQTYRGDSPHLMQEFAKNGLIRIQWGGPWTKVGVPMRVRYRKTHWVGCRFVEGSKNVFQIFDVNAMCVGGWLSFGEWSERLVPWLLKKCVPKHDGTWWATHTLEVEPDAKTP